VAVVIGGVGGAAVVGCGDAVAPAPVCAAYVACVRAGDAARGAATDVARFEEGGACWSGEVGAGRCAEACARGLARLRAQEPATCPEAAP
jgi:hypothetical protein